MTNPTISNAGAQQDLVLVQGAALYPIKVTVTNPDTSPMDLTGCTVYGQIRRNLQATEVAASFTIAYGEPRTSGWFSYELSAADTLAIKCGADATSQDSSYVYDLKLVDASSRTMQIVYGKISIQPSASRPS